VITGASGLLGTKLAQVALGKGHKVFAAYKDHQPTFGIPVSLDVTDEVSVRKTISQLKPDVIVNSAALTDVDKCEMNPQLAREMNSTAVEHLAKSAKELSCFLVQMSTDSVFDGTKGNYSETDLPRAINQYGLSKLAGEEAAKTCGEGLWSIARASVVYGWGRAQRPNAATHILNSLSKGQKVFIVNDQYSSPTLNTNLALMVIELCERRLPGIIHTAGATRLSRYEFALGLADLMKLEKKLILPTEAENIEWKATRQMDSSLQVSRAMSLLASRPLEIDDAYRLFGSEKPS
jgi:dTDP-4-dehydrorhamnose reductase